MNKPFISHDELVSLHIRSNGAFREAMDAQRMLRISQILEERHIFERGHWLDMVDEAVILAFVALSGIEWQRHVDDYFFAKVDCLYAGTLLAAEVYSPEDLRHIVHRSESIRARIEPTVSTIINQARLAIIEFGDSDIRYVVGTDIAGFRSRKFTDSISRESHSEIVIACCNFVSCTRLFYSHEIDAIEYSNGLREFSDSLYAAMPPMKNG